MALENDQGGELESVANVERRHLKVHQGKAFSVTHVVENVATLGVAELYFRTGGTPLHASAAIGAGGNALIEFFAAASVTSDGSTLAVLSNNQVTSESTSAEFFSAPVAATSAATPVQGYVYGGVTGVGSNAQAFGSGASAGGGIEEVVLAPSSAYLLRVTNRADLVLSAITFSLSYYKET